MLSITYVPSSKRLWMESASFWRVLSYYGMAEGAWSDSADHFFELVGVNAKSVKCSRL